jgi:hypothetical protein
MKYHLSQLIQIATNIKTKTSLEQIKEYLLSVKSKDLNTAKNLNTSINDYLTDVTTDRLKDLDTIFNKQKASALSSRLGTSVTLITNKRGKKS